VSRAEVEEPDEGDIPPLDDKWDLVFKYLEESRQEFCAKAKQNFATAVSDTAGNQTPDLIRGLYKLALIAEQDGRTGKQLAKKYGPRTATQIRVACKWIFRLYCRDQFGIKLRAPK